MSTVPSISDNPSSDIRRDCVFVMSLVSRSCGLSQRIMSFSCSGQLFPIPSPQPWTIYHPGKCQGFLMFASFDLKLSIFPSVCNTICIFAGKALAALLPFLLGIFQGWSYAQKPTWVSDFSNQTTWQRSAEVSSLGRFPTLFYPLIMLPTQAVWTGVCYGLPTFTHDILSG